MRTFLSIFFVLVSLITTYILIERYRFHKWLEIGTTKIVESENKNSSVDLNELPPLLQKYLKKVIIKKSPANHVYFTQAGKFKMSPEAEMSNFMAEQYVSTNSSMFSWVAAISMKGLTVTVCDRLIEKKGELQARLFSAIPIAKGSGDRFLRGELLRYLAELPWYPIAILNQPEIAWKEIAENKLSGTIVVDEVSATVEYTFNKENLVESIYVPDREKSDDGKTFEKLPWLGEFSNYQEQAGMLIPINGKVSWLLESGKFTYFEGSIGNFTLKNFE